MTTDARTTESTSDPTWVVSVVFWLTLLIAVVIYAAVALAPKLERFMVLKRDHEIGQWQLVSLDKRVQQLDRVAHALEDDPQFAAELARSRFGAVDEGQAAISISNDLQINFPTVSDPVDVKLPWYYGPVKQFASNPTLRWSALGIAATLILVGFGFLHARYSSIVRSGVGRFAATARGLGRRYRT